ncbi:MAG: TM2 domain-containing protein [Eubacteriales bacterium]|nr:TM2 domain-containing protein [Eubacteriales bacterium]
MTYCAYCKSRIGAEDRKCPSCGSTTFVTQPEEPAAQPSAEPQVVYQTIHHTVYVEKEAQRSESNRWIALILCLLGGMIGLHRFYTRKVGTGVLYLLTGGLCGMGAIVDFLTILFGSYRDKDGRKLAG